PDALFHDPYARRLAGARGEEMLATMPRAMQYGWPMVVRTAVMDEIIVRLAPQVDAVLNLAAGLDARPYRLDLPKNLRWIEVDFPSTIDYKTSLLADAPARCALERVALDLSDRDARRALFNRLGSAYPRMLAISEGLLVYLGADNAGALADDLAAIPSMRWWLTDIASPWVLRIMRRTWGKRLEQGGAPFLFAPKEAGAFFTSHGWTIREYHPNMIEGERLNRFPFAWFWRILFWRAWARAPSQRDGQMVGVLLLENAKRTG
ncbi:MAG: class I SAM-dependent methyltransferase, partial [Candidatus Eremiobacteraeota bacterium]|nr:class I SAM-dependent methyltransferase [Candidatus Eremiobacteraeota bacterium]